MSEFRSYQPRADCAQEAMDNVAFCFALAEHGLKNVTALAESMAAAFCSAGEANTHVLNTAIEDLGQRIGAATAFTTVAPPGDLLTAHVECARRACEQYAANARALRITLIAGARAFREPLLERLG